MNNGPRVEIKMAKVELIGAFNDVQQRDFLLKQKCMFLTKNITFIRLKLLLSRNSHHIFAPDLFYHHSCCLRYSQSRENSSKADCKVYKQKKDNLLAILYSKIRQNKIEERG